MHDSLSALSPRSTAVARTIPWYTLDPLGLSLKVYLLVHPIVAKKNTM